MSKDTYQLLPYVAAEDTSSFRSNYAEEPVRTGATNTPKAYSPLSDAGFTRLEIEQGELAT